MWRRKRAEVADLRRVSLERVGLLGGEREAFKAEPWPAADFMKSMHDIRALQTLIRDRAFLCRRLAGDGVTSGRVTAPRKSAPSARSPHASGPRPPKGMGRVRRPRLLGGFAVDA